MNIAVFWTWYFDLPRNCVLWFSLCCTLW